MQENINPFAHTPTPENPMQKMLQALCAILLAAVLAACTTDPMSGESSPRLTTYTQGGLKVTFPGTAFVPGGGGGDSLTCEVQVAVKNNTGLPLSGYGTVTTGGGFPLQASVQFLPTGTSNFTLPVTGPSGGFTAQIQFNWAGDNVTYSPSGDVYCAYI